MATTTATSGRSASQGDRDSMITENLALVHHVARRIAGPGLDEADYQDLVSAGTVGLMSAVDNFDESRGFSFSTYAAPKIRGAILDDLRRRDSATRSMREKRRKIARAREAVSARRQEAPDDAEVAEELGIDVETLWKWEQHARSGQRTSLESTPGDDDGLTVLELLEGPGPGSVEEDLQERERTEALEQALLDLPEQERTVLALYYFEELKLREIGEVLGLTESRISQIRTGALETLRNQEQLLALSA